MNKKQVIDKLQLEEHVEGGYFRRTYESSMQISVKQQPRHLLTSIYYLLSDDSPIGHFHQNHSDIIHYYHLGGVLKYYLISPQGELKIVLLGHDMEQGQQLQLTVPGGYWKASMLINGEFGLISEAVAPGFKYSDMHLANNDQMHSDFPDLFEQIKHLIKS